MDGCDRNRIIEHVANIVRSASQYSEPFLHLQLADVFPDDIYARMLEAMPDASDYRPMSGRTSYTRLPGGGGTRVKIDLFPEYVRHLPGHKQAIWRSVGDALCSAQVRNAFRERLSSGLRHRFGRDHNEVSVYPIPTLTRDIKGYRIRIHSDTHSKVITVQLYLPRDRSIEHVGTIFHKRVGDNTYEKSLQMPFAPNTGYAFAVDSNTYHSVDTVGPEVDTRDSILLTYFADQTAVQMLRNRTRRFCNGVLNEFRQRRRQRTS